jgi:hypothetical protein
VHRAPSCSSHWSIPAIRPNRSASRISLALLVAIVGFVVAWFARGVIFTLGYVEDRDSYVLVGAAKISSEVAFAIGLATGLAIGFVLWRRPRKPGTPPVRRAADVERPG